MKLFWFSVRLQAIGFVALSICASTLAATDPPKAIALCLADGQGFFRARISGSIQAELNWASANLDCTGAMRPDGGVRMRFSHPYGKAGQRLVFLFGIPTLREGQGDRNLPVNLTVIREGAGEFFGTTGPDKCSLDEVRQEAIVGIPRRNRSYRVTARGFCMQPAPAVTGKGSVLVSRFDFSGRVDFAEEDNSPEAATGVKPETQSKPNPNPPRVN